MKRYARLMILVAVLLLSAAFRPCEAKDVWVAHWNSENLDIYVMDETIEGGTADTGKYFKVSTKRVRDGKLVDVVHWSYSKFRSDMWRYETNTMDGSHTTVVTPGDKVFEFCMGELGWEYRVQQFWCY
ncbi:MAG: hypothetical protein IJU05_07085 [Schwartzia sp.]|nr:hypothetical protein [Schwartzia sp. (in: firmicutes)]